MKGPRPGDKIAVWFSCGAASAVAAAQVLARWGASCDVRVLNTPVAEEPPDNRRFLGDVQQWLKCPIEIVSNPAWPGNSAVDVWAKRRFMSGPLGAPCTVELKKRARQLWEEENCPDWNVLGYTFDEKKRADRFRLTERDNLLDVLVMTRTSKAECFEIIMRAGLQLPDAYAQGYPNANCIGCVKATSPTYWNHVRATHPVVFKERAAQSRDIGARLVRVKGERVFLDDLAPSEKGAPMKTMQTECGIFCEEPS